MKEGLSKELLEFIVLHVDSVELLEVFLLLHSDAEREWTIPDIDAQIRSTQASIESRLSQLIRVGLVSKYSGQPDRYKYMPSDAHTRRIGDELAVVYQSRRVEIVELIYLKPMKEIISFSSAFIFKGSKKKDG